MYRQSAMLVFLVIFIASCGSGGLNYHGYTPGTPAFLFYVESVETVPPVVHAGEPYEIVARVSSQLNPDLLRGGPVDNWWEVSATNWNWTGIFNYMAPSDSDPGEYILAYNPWVINPPYTGELVDTITLTSSDAAVEGTRSYKVLTADSREWGGLESTYYCGASELVLEHPHAVYRQFEITVLPEEEGGAQ